MPSHTTSQEGEVVGERVKQGEMRPQAWMKGDRYNPESPEAREGGRKHAGFCSGALQPV